MLTVKGTNVFGGAIGSDFQKSVAGVTGYVGIVKEDQLHSVTEFKLRVEYLSGMEDQFDGLGKEIRDHMRLNRELGQK